MNLTFPGKMIEYTYSWNTKCLSGNVFQKYWRLKT